MKRAFVAVAATAGLLALAPATPASPPTDKAGCDSIRLGEVRVFYKQNMRCAKAKHHARRLYKTDGRDQPRNFTCESGSNFNSGASCRHDSKPKYFGWHPLD